MSAYVSHLRQPAHDVRAFPWRDLAHLPEDVRSVRYTGPTGVGVPAPTLVARGWPTNDEDAQPVDQYVAAADAILGTFDLRRWRTAPMLDPVTMWPWPFVRISNGVEVVTSVHPLWVRPLQQAVDRFTDAASYWRVLAFYAEALSSLSGAELDVYADVAHLGGRDALVDLLRATHGSPP